MRRHARNFIALQLAAILLLSMFSIKTASQDKSASKGNSASVQENKTDSNLFRDFKAVADFYLEMSKKDKIPAEVKKVVAEHVNEFPKLSTSFSPSLVGANPCPKGYEWRGNMCVKVGENADDFRDLTAIADFYLRTSKKGEMPADVIEKVKLLMKNFSDQSASFASCPKGYRKVNGNCIKVN